MTIEVMPGVPPEVSGDVMARLSHFRRVIPAWCDRIEVKYDPDDIVCYARIWVNYSNRNACIAISGSYLSLSDLRRDRVLVHELAHLYTCPISDAAKNITERYIKDEAGLSVADGIITERLESSTEDLAILFSNVLAYRPANTGMAVSVPVPPEPKETD